MATKKSASAKTTPAKKTAVKKATTVKTAAKKAAVKKAPAKKAPAKKAAAEPKKLRVAFIGCGGIFRTHMHAYKQIPEVEIVGYCDIKPEQLEYCKKEYGATPEMCFEKWDDMLKAVKPDAVDVCTPNGVHMPAAIAAANAGCHVMVEKPMAMNPAECEKMIAAAKKNKVKLAVGFQHRYNSKTDFLMNAKKEGQFGNLMFVKCQALRRRGIPNWGVFGQKELQGGGPMIDIGVHVVEMAHFFMDEPKPVAASGNCWTYLGNKPSEALCVWPNWDWKTYTVEDLAIGHIRFDNGMIMQIESSFASHIEKDLWTFTAMGDKGGCSWDPLKIFTDKAGAMVTITPDYIAPDWNSDWLYLFVRKLRNWVDAILRGTPLRAPGESGLMVQKILDGIYRSAEQGGKEVKID